MIDQPAFAVTSLIAPLMCSIELNRTRQSLIPNLYVEGAINEQPILSYDPNLLC
jgi:hypothetical protein